jgi:hypothetical protein
LAHANITGVISTASGWDSELRAARWLFARRWRILAHDIRISGIQIDLLTRDPQGVLTIIEVKSQSRLAHLSQSQLRRLMRVGVVLSGYEPVQLRLLIAGVNEMHLLPVDALTV